MTSQERFILLAVLGLGAVGVGVWFAMRSSSGALQAPRQTGPAVPSGDLPVAPTARAECPRVGARVLLIGDSYAAGLGPHMEVMAKACEIPFAFHGVVGSSATQWQKDGMVGADIRNTTPTVVLLSIGGNDFQRDSETVKAASRALASKILASGAKLLWIAPLDIPVEDKAGARAFWWSIVGQDGYDSTQLHLLMASDGLHPQSYAAWALDVWQWMGARA